MVFSVELINKNGKKFIMQEAECKNADYVMTSKLFKQSLPDGTAEDAIVINLGQEKSWTFPMQLRATTVDAAESTHSSSVLTIQQKVDYLEGTFFTTGLEDLYTINVYTSCANILGKKGILDGFSFNPTSEKPNVLPGQITMSIGGGKQ